MSRMTTLLVLAQQAADSDIGYDQGDRYSYLNTAKRTLNPKGETDCSALTLGLLWLAGYLASLVDGWTGNMKGILKAAGFTEHTYSPGAPLTPGDVILAPGHHVVIAMTASTVLSAEADERGRARGGQSGDQTGREVRIRTAYDMTNGGKRGAFILRPPADPAGIPPATAIVTNCYALNLREKPASTSKVLAVANRGTVVTLTGPASGRWLPVTLNGRAGWMHAAYLAVR